MTSLHMISLPLDLRAFRRWAAQRGCGDEGVALHHLLSETFGKGVTQPFRIMVAPRGGGATLYAYSPDDEAALRRTAAETGAPDALAICDPATLKVKTMPEVWSEGRRLAFDVRVRPVRRLLRSAGEFPKGAELDAFLVEALRRYRAGRPDEGRLAREDVYLDWLRERLARAAQITGARIARFERSAAVRGGRTANGPDVTIHGELTVLDGELFADRLAKGVGRHAAYGYGMLLLRPSRPANA